MGPHLSMRVLLALSPVLLGVSWSNSFLNQLIPDVDFDHEDCKGDACFPLNQLLHLDRQKSGKLTYNVRSVAYASTENILAACLSGVAKEAMAESFLSCREKKMEDICTFAKRGWLVKDSKEESVPNLDFLTASFNGLPGGAEAVKKCMKVKEEAEAEDDYWDYYDYYDEYDYLEEGESIAIRSKREAGKKQDKKDERKRRRRKKKESKKRKGDQMAKKITKIQERRMTMGRIRKQTKRQKMGKEMERKTQGGKQRKGQETKIIKGNT